MLLHEVLTNEKVTVTYRVAGMGSRFLAWLVDCLLIALLSFVGLLVGSVYESIRAGLGLALIVLWMFTLTWGYFFLFEWLWSGQTPGKRLLGIRVIEWQGTGISYYQAAVRNIVRVVDSLPLFYTVGFIVAACNRMHRRLGDLAAGTLVVHVDRKAKPIQPLHDRISDSEHSQEILTRQRLGQLSRQQKQTLVGLCARRDQLRVQDRARLFAAVAEYFTHRLDLSPGQYQSDEKFILHLVSLLSAQRK